MKLLQPDCALHWINVWDFTLCFPSGMCTNVIMSIMLVHNTEFLHKSVLALMDEDSGAVVFCSIKFWCESFK